MKKFIALIALAIASVTVHADEVAAYGIHIGSHHFPAYQYNNFNPGLYVRMKSGLTAGAYYNSERRPSAYLGYTHEWGRFAVTVGAVSGYTLGRGNPRIYPMIVPSVKLGTVENVTFRLAVMPQVSKNMGATALHLMAEF